MRGSFVRTIATLLLAGAAACDGGPVAPGEIIQTLTERLETQSIVFHFSAGDRVDTDWQQRFHDWIEPQLGVRLPAKLQYYKYTGRSQMRAVTGMETNGFAEPEVYSVHSIFPSDGHEAVHVYSALVGRPSDFFNEGIAVTLNSEPGALPLAPRWNGTHVYEHTQLLVQTGQLRPLQTIVTTAAFRDVHEWVGYGEAGSFLLFLIEEFGLDHLLSFFRISGRDDSRASIESAFRSVWGISLAEAEQRWLQTIADWGG